MLLRNWLDDLFLYAPSGAAAEAAEAGEITDEDVAGATDESPIDTDDDEDAGEPDEGVDAEAVTEGDETAEPTEKSLREYGFDTDDPAELQQRFTETQRQLQQYQQRAQQMEAMYWQNQQMLMQQQQQNAAPPEKPKLPWGTAPEFDPNWATMLDRDENGRLIAPNGVDPTIPQKFQAYNQWLVEAQRKFFSDPVGPIQESIAPWVQQQAQQVAQQMLFQHEQQRQLRDHSEKYREVYFDATGNLNQYGQMFNQRYAEARQIGHPDPVNYAQAFVDSHLIPYIAQQQQAPSKSQKEQRREFQKKATRIPNRTGTLPNGHRKKPAQNGKDPWAHLRSELESLPKEDFSKR